MRDDQIKNVGMFYKAKWLYGAFAISYITAAIEWVSAGRLSLIIPYTLVIPFFITLPRMIYQWHSRKNKRGSWALLSSIEKALFVVVIFNAPASLFLHNLGFQYDRFLHFMMGIAYGYAFILTLSLFIKHPENLMRGGSFIALIIICASMLFLWEGGQFSIDTWTGTHLFSDKEQSVIQDFWEDILFGFSGGAIVLLYLKSKWQNIFQTQIQPEQK